MGAKYKNIELGISNHSVATIFSLHPVKTITSGEGGVLLTNKLSLYKKCKLKSTWNHQGHILPWSAEMKTLGFNYKLTEMQCALGFSQFKKIKKFILFRKKFLKYIQKIWTKVFQSSRNTIRL